jgi:fatty acid desaturase
MNETAAPPYRLNAAFAATVIALAVVQLFVVPLVLLPQAPVVAMAAVGLIALATPFATAVLHEAIHGRLDRQADRNDFLGRALAVCAGVSFDVVRFGHLSHHRFNRHALDRPDVIEPGASALGAGIKYYAHLFGGLYLGEVLTTLAMLLPRRMVVVLLRRAMAADEVEITTIRIAAMRVLERRHRQIRNDAICVIALYSIAFALYGAWWSLLLGGIFLHGLIVSVQDNLPHYGTPAVINADAHNSWAPRWMSLFMLNQNFHAVHHERPDLHWNELPGAFVKAGRRYSADYPALLLRQFRGPRRPQPGAPAA